MPDELVVVNNTPLVALWTVSRVDLLRGLFEEILIPPAVRAEFLAVDFDARQRFLAESSWIKVVPEVARGSAGVGSALILAAFQAASGLRGLLTQGIGLRPQPWAPFSRPVGPATHVMF